MAEQVVGGVGDSQQIVPVSDLNCVGTGLNYICLKSQLDDVIVEFKSLQTIISLLQKETGQNYTDLVQVRCSNINQLDMLESQVQNIRDNMAIKYIGTNGIKKEKSQSFHIPTIITTNAMQISKVQSIPNTKNNFELRNKC
jgi:hypothetical protein